MGNVVDLTATFKTGNASWAASLHVEPPTTEQGSILRDIAKELRDEVLSKLIEKIIDADYDEFGQWLQEKTDITIDKLKEWAEMGAQFWDKMIELLQSLPRL